MRLAFCIFKYFPYGGLQRDMYAAVNEAIARGHSVDIYTMHWQGDQPAGAHIHVLTVFGWTNHARARRFSAMLQKILNGTYYDRIIGFNKIPNVDLYFTGENCFAQHVKNKASPIIRFFPRYWIFSRLESQVFSPKSATEILLISPQEKSVYQKFYHTQDARFHFLFPSISPRTFSNEEAHSIRQAMREKYTVSSDKTWLLFVASDYALKGLQRILTIFSEHDDVLSKNVILTVIGQDDAAPYQQYLLKNNIKTRVDFLGASDDVYAFMASADVLVHPAKLELAGKVLLEAMVNHLPIITTAICGCAHYVAESGGGIILSEPYSSDACYAALLACLQKETLSMLRKNLMAYSLDRGVYHSHQQLIDYIDNLPGRAVRDFFLDDYVKSRLPLDKKTCIQYIFSLSGEVYRQVKTRKTIFTHLFDQDYFIKMHRGVGWYEILKNVLVFKSVALGAKQEYQAICAMQQADILVPEVCAYATDGVNPAKISSFIMTKRIHYQYDLEKFCQTWVETPPNFLLKRRLIQRVAEIARKMHAAGMNHRDFYLCHLLLDQRSDIDFDLYLIDLHRVQIRKTVPLRWKVKDLSGLTFSAMGIGLSRLDGFYFLKHYYQQPITTILRKKWLLWWWIHLKAKRLYRRHQKKWVL